MKRFKVENNKKNQTIYVTLHQAPYENENILNKTGWNEKDVIISQVGNTSGDEFDDISHSVIDSDFIGEE
tara:strand:- start:325 stop:534 length:210 start_codon:yes stop_codon:yes gene_type:complete